jgi:hypothetical protein
MALKRSTPSKSAKKVRFYVNPVIPFLTLIFGVGLAAVMIWIVITTPAVEGTEIYGTISCIIMGTTMPSIFLFTAIKFWQSVRLSPVGIKKSLFNIFFARKLSWEDIQEIRIIFLPMNGYWVFFSKTSIEGLPYDKAMRRKDQINIMYSKKLLSAIRQFTDKEIINLPTEKDGGQEQ